LEQMLELLITQQIHLSQLKFRAGLNSLTFVLDVCTGGELAVAITDNFPAKKNELHGNNKSESEIAIAID